jgi:predicted RNase H-like HicB family nuclease
VSTLRKPARICESQPASAVVGATIVVMLASRTFTAAVHREEDWYVAQCLEVDVASQGETLDEAIANLQEAVALYLDEIDDPDRHITRTPLVTSFQVPGAA